MTLHPTQAATALRAITSAGRIYIPGGTGHPNQLAAALVEMEFDGAAPEIVTSLMGPLPPYCDDLHRDRFVVRSFRATSATRDAVEAGRLAVIPVSLSAIPGLLAGVLRPDAALIKVSLPDRHGWCSLGPSVLYHRAAISAAETVIAEISPAVPRTFGDGFLHVSELDAVVESDAPLLQTPGRPATPAESALAEEVCALIPNGATVQVGMGRFGDAVIRALRVRHGLRIHAGLLGDAIVDLDDAGALDRCVGSVTTGALVGTDRLYEWARENPAVSVRRVEYTHHPAVLAGLPGLISINSALEVDAMGQANSEKIGGIPVSGSGGALDFARGAIASGGMSIVALASASNSGTPRLVEHLGTESVVTIPRTEVDIVVTERGVADLRGRSDRERQRRLSAIGLVADPVPEVQAL